MHYSIEPRAPFLSQRLFKFIFSLKKNFFMYKGIPKSILRLTMSKFLHKKITSSYEKIGFYSPFNSFFNIKDFRRVKSYISKSKIISRILKKKQITNLLSLEPSEVKHNESKLLFACLNFSILENVISKYRFN